MNKCRKQAGPSKVQNIEGHSLGPTHGNKAGRVLAKDGALVQMAAGARVDNDGQHVLEGVLVRVRGLARDSEAQLRAGNGMSLAIKARRVTCVLKLHWQPRVRSRYARVDSDIQPTPNAPSQKRPKTYLVSMVRGVDEVDGRVRQLGQHAAQHPRRERFA